MTEQELKDAIALACKADYERAMAAPKHRFSRKFRKKIKELLQPGIGKRTIPKLYPVHGRRRAIVVVAVLVLLLGTTVMAKGFFQSVLGKHVLTGYNDHVQLNLPESDDEAELLMENVTEEETETETNFEFVCKKPQWVPEGYELEWEDYNDDIPSYDLNYGNEKNQVFLYQQIQSGVIGNFGISSNGENLQKVMVGKYNGYWIPDNESDKERGNIIWTDEKYIYAVEGYLSKRELLKIAESVKE